MYEPLGMFLAVEHCFTINLEVLSSMLGACEVLMLQEGVGCTPEVREMSPRL